MTNMSGHSNWKRLLAKVKRVGVYSLKCRLITSVGICGMAELIPLHLSRPASNGWYLLYKDNCDCIKKSQPQLWDVISYAHAESSWGNYLERRILINVSVLDFLLSLVPVSSMSRINGVTCMHLFGCLPSVINKFKPLLCWMQVFWMFGLFGWISLILVQHSYKLTVHTRCWTRFPCAILDECTGAMQQWL